jgi:hypothetical protein
MSILRLKLWYGRPSAITLADRARDTGQWELAARHYREALDRNPRNPPIWVQYGHVMKEWGFAAEAERAYRRAIELDPKAADPHLQLGHALKIQGKRAEAADAYRWALALDPSLYAVMQPLHAPVCAVQQPSCYYIKTAHGTYLCANKVTGRVEHKSEIDDSSLPLLYFELESETEFGFFTPAGSLDEFLCGEAVGPGGVLRVRRIQASSDRIAFQHGTLDSFLCAKGQHSASVAFDCEEAHEWAIFALYRVRWTLSMARHALATDLISSSGQGWSPLSDINKLLSCRGNDQDQLLVSCFERLTFDEFVALLDAIRARLLNQQLSDGLLRRLLQLRAASTIDNPFVPEALIDAGDPQSAFWLERVLPDLMAWRRDRNSFLGPNHHVRLGTDLNFLQGLEHGVSTAATGRLYNFVARFTTEPTRDICVVTTARNEGVYLLEWLAYHRSIGVETFFVYSNDNDDGSDALLRRLSEAGAIYWLENIVDSETAAQRKAFSHALNALPHVLDYRWALFIDLDEFVVVDPDRFCGLPDYIAWQEQRPVDAIGFNWVWVGSSGQDKWSPDFVRSRFTQRYIGVTPSQCWGGPDRHIKSIFRPQRFLACQPHHPITDRHVPVAMLDSSGYPHLNYYGGDQPAFLLHPKAEAAWVNHYFFKSAEEFVWKRSRNAGDTVLPHLLTPDWLRAFASQHWSQDFVDDDRILHCGKDFQEHYDALLSIYGVSEIISEVYNTFRRELEKIKSQLITINQNFQDELVQRFLESLSH